MEFEDFFKDIYKFTEKNRKKIEEFGKGQHPDISLIQCSDSRLSIPIKNKLGKIFTIREMGSIINDSSIASIEYSVMIGVKKLLFMGHTNCGAIKGALSLIDEHENEEKKEIMKSEFLMEFMRNNIIKPLNLTKANKNKKSINELVIENEIIQIKKLLKESDLIRKKFIDDKIEIEICQYCTETGKIEFRNKFKNLMLT